MLYSILEVELGASVSAGKQGTKRSDRNTIVMQQLLPADAPKSIGCRIEILKLPSPSLEYKKAIEFAQEKGWHVADGGFCTLEVSYPAETSPKGQEFTLLSSRHAYFSLEELHNAVMQLQYGFGFRCVTNGDEEKSHDQSKYPGHSCYEHTHSYF